MKHYERESYGIAKWERFFWGVFLPLGLFLAIFWMGAPRAEDAGVAIAAPSVVAPVVIPSTDIELIGGARDLITNVRDGKWWMALGLFITLAVGALRKWDIHIPKYGPAIDAFFNKPLVAFSLPFVLSGIGGVTTALAAHVPVTEILGLVWKVASAAIVAFIGWRQIGESRDAGKLAADAIGDKATADALLKEGPKP